MGQAPAPAHAGACPLTVEFAMIQFILKRLGQAVIVVFLVTIITFILLQSQPGGAARAALGKDATKEQLAASTTRTDTIARSPSSTSTT